MRGERRGERKSCFQSVAFEWDMHGEESRSMDCVTWHKGQANGLHVSCLRHRGC